MINELQKETKEKKVLFDYTDKVVEFIVEKGYNEKFGARPLRRAIQKYIEDPLALKFIKGEIKEKQKYTVDIQDGKVVIN